MITQSIILAIPLLLMAGLGGFKTRMVALALATPLADAALVNLGSFSLQVRWAVALVVIGRFVTDMSFRPTPVALGRRTIARLMPLIALWCWNLVLISFSPAMFPQIDETMPGSAMFQWQRAVPLAQQSESFNQAVYLLVCIVLTGVMAVSFGRDPASMRKNIHLMVNASFLCAAFWFYWHVLHVYGGLPFPNGLMHSDLHSSAWDQAVAGVPRPSGSFGEPSGVAGFLTPFTFYYFEYYLRRGKLIWLGAAGLVAAALALSTSTAGYAGLAAFACWVVVRWLGGGLSMGVGAGASKRQMSSTTIFVIFAGLVALVAWVFFIDQTVARALFEEQVMEKSTSISYLQRSYANNLAREIFADTWGLGIGFGNHRASSLLMALMSGVGIPGIVCFVYYLIDMGLRCIKWGRGPGVAPEDRGYGWVFAAFLGGGTMSMMFTAGELQSLWYWLVASGATALAVAPAPQRQAPPRRYPAPVYVHR